MFKEVNFPVLLQLLAKHGMNRQHVAEIIHRSYRQTIKKLSKQAPFDIEEARNIVVFFRGLGDNVSVESIFFDEAVSNEN